MQWLTCNPEMTAFEKWLQPQKIDMYVYLFSLWPSCWAFTHTKNTTSCGELSPNWDSAHVVMCRNLWEKVKNKRVLWPLSWEAVQLPLPPHPLLFHQHTHSPPLFLLQPLFSRLSQLTSWQGISGTGHVVETTVLSLLLFSLRFPLLSFSHM